MLRYALASGLVMALLCSCSSQSVPASPPPPAGLIAITVDDIPQHGTLPPGETRVEVTRTMIAALQSAGVPAYGFVNGARANTPDAAAALQLWSEAFPVGNHTWSHANLDEVSATRYRKEIEANEPLLERLSPDRDWHWFRYPYLAEGTDAAKRAKIRKQLAARGYRIAAVTTDFTDYAYNAPYARCVVKADATAITTLETDYLDAARAAALRSQEMARSLYGSDIPQVLLTHVGAFDARMFPRLLDAYREMGFRFVTLDEAQNHPHYAEDNRPSLPAARSGLESKMYGKDLKPPPKRTPKLDLDALCR